MGMLTHAHPVNLLGLSSHSPSHHDPVALVTGEGNGNLLQYSCLENPMDGGA